MAAPSIQPPLRSGSIWASAPPHTTHAPPHTTRTHKHTVTHKAQQLPQPPWLRMGVTLPAARQSTTAGGHDCCSRRPGPPVASPPGPASPGPTPSEPGRSSAPAHDGEERRQKKATHNASCGHAVKPLLYGYHIYRHQTRVVSRLPCHLTSLPHHPDPTLLLLSVHCPSLPPPSLLAPLPRRSPVGMSPSEPTSMSCWRWKVSKSVSQ